MQGVVLQLTRVGFLLLLWLFIWSVLRILRTDIYAPTGAVMVRRGLPLRGSLLPSRGKRNVARQLVVTDGALAGTRITLGSQAVLIGRADEDRKSTRLNSSHQIISYAVFCLKKKKKTKKHNRTKKKKRHKKKKRL